MHFPHISALFLALSVVSAVPHQHRGNLPCYEDNTLRALERFASEAASFCPKLQASPGAPVPSVFVQYQARITSACSCFEKTAGTIAPTTASMGTSSPVASMVPTTTAMTSPTKSFSMAPTKPTLSTSSVKSTSSPVIVSTSVSTSSSAPMKPATTSVSSSTASSASSTSSPVSTVVASGGTAKRGLVYDYNSKSAYADFFVGSKYVSFGSNWGDTRATGNGVTIPNSFAFVPTLAVNGNLESDDWNDTAKAAIQSGSKYLFASNEPDNSGQANLSPQDTATVYKRYMQQFKGQALLGTPAVTNGGGSTGLNFLGDFLDNCQECHFDMINIHHYVQRSDMDVDQAVSALKSYIETNVPALQAKYKNIQGLPIMVGEFWLWDASLTEAGTYLESIMPYLDGNTNIIGYQAFGGLWTGNFITSDGTGLTPAGTAYKNFYQTS